MELNQIILGDYKGSSVVIEYVIDLPKTYGDFEFFNTGVEHFQLLKHLEDNNIILPIYVVEEIDKLKRSEGEKGRNARLTARTIDELRKNGSLFKGVTLPKGGTFRVEIKGDYKNLPSFLQKDVMDNRILAVVIELSKEINEKVILVTINTGFEKNYF
jgi:PhoH-like ATPase